MQRLTEWTGEEWIPVQERVNGKIIGNKTCLKKLAAYEDIGLEPEEILTIKKAIEMLCKDFPRNVGEAINMLPVSLFSQ